MNAAMDLRAAASRRRTEPLAVSGDVVGYIGLDTPTELISAAGFTPVRVIAGASSEGVEAYAEGLGNPVLRGLAAALLEGPYQDLKRLIISPTPAAYGWLASFLRELRRGGEGPAGLEVVLFDLNHGRTAGLSAIRRNTVADLAKTLGDWAGRAVARDLPEAVAGANRTRRELRVLEGLRAEGRISGVDALAAFAAREAMDEGDYQVALAGFAQEAGAPIAARRVIYSGVETITPEPYGRLEEAGRLIVGDDQDAGSRSIGREVAEGGDLLAALAKAYAARDPAPAKSALGDRISYLLEMVRRTHAEEVIFALTAFDHPAGWEAPALMEALQAEGIACTRMEAAGG